LHWAAAEAHAICRAACRQLRWRATGTEGTVWDVSPLGPTATATLSYPQPTTALAFAAAGNTLIAGHPDGSITVHAINPTSTDATKRTLTGHNGPINAVAVAANASVALGVDQAGTLTVWNLTSRSTEPASTTTGASGTGAHRAWISSDGGFAVLADATSPPTLWSLVDPTHPYRLARLPQGGPPAVPAMVSADGHTMISIDPVGTLRVWNLTPVDDVARRWPGPGLEGVRPPIAGRARRRRGRFPLLHVHVPAEP
jgi:WD40 repeat protein